MSTTHLGAVDLRPGAITYYECNPVFASEDYLYRNELIKHLMWVSHMEDCGYVRDEPGYSPMILL